MNHISLQEAISLNGFYLMEPQCISDWVKTFNWSKILKLALEQNPNPEGKQLWIYLELSTFQELLCYNIYFLCTATYFVKESNDIGGFNNSFQVERTWVGFLTGSPSCNVLTIFPQRFLSFWSIPSDTLPT